MSVKSTAWAASRQSTSGSSNKADKPSVKFRLRYAAVVVVLCWGAYHYWEVQRPAAAKLTAQAAQLRTELNSMQEKQRDLSIQVKQLQSDKYIAQYASQHYNLDLPGQVSFVMHH